MRWIGLLLYLNHRGNIFCDGDWLVELHSYSVLVVFDVLVYLIAKRFRCAVYFITALAVKRTTLQNWLCVIRTSLCTEVVIQVIPISTCQAVLRLNYTSFTDRWTSHTRSNLKICSIRATCNASCCCVVTTERWTVSVASVIIPQSNCTVTSYASSSICTQRATPQTSITGL